MIFLKTFKEAHEVDPTINEEEFRLLSRNHSLCGNCDNHVWRYAATGLCFTCTTGEADSSDDYEIGEEY
jgi:hypothetical protein